MFSSIFFPSNHFPLIQKFSQIIISFFSFSKLHKWWTSLHLIMIMIWLLNDDEMNFYEWNVDQHLEFSFNSNQIKNLNHCPPVETMMDWVENYHFFVDGWMLNRNRYVNEKKLCNKKNVDADRQQFQWSMLNSSC